MSQKNVECVRRGFERFGETGKVRGSSLHPDFEVFDHDIPDARNPYRGAAGFNAWVWRRSRLVIIKLFREWDLSRCVEPNVHAWGCSSGRVSLTTSPGATGSSRARGVGLAPATKPVALLRDLRRRRRGEITYGELGRRVKITESHAVWGFYAGYAVSPAALRA